MPSSKNDEKTCLGESLVTFYEDDLVLFLLRFLHIYLSSQMLEPKMVVLIKNITVAALGTP
jgi:hypothetical protein